MAQSNIVIQTNNLTQKYGTFTAVNNVNMTVREGEIFGFLGPNGAGKTSTIRTIMDFLRPASGSVSVFGLDSQQHSTEIRRRVGYLPSELTLWENWRGTQYVRWLEKVHETPIMAEAKRLADALAFDLNRPLQGMSTGMKRKMGLIAALAHKPQLLILDEPTSGLDPLMQKVFHNLMLDAKSEGRTVFLSSHMLTEVEQICDRVGIIRDGELQAVETISNLTASTFRWLTFTINGAIHRHDFDTLPGVTDVSLNGQDITMRVTGQADMGDIIRQAAKYDIADMRMVKPTLEEIFLAFYGGDTQTGQLTDATETKERIF